ncbi:unnamed protein product [Ascophyllum nodosum]
MVSDLPVALMHSQGKLSTSVKGRGTRLMSTPYGQGEDAGVHERLGLSRHRNKMAEEELMVPQKVETGDSVKMKQVMDDAVIKAVLEMGYDEDHTLNNAKLAIMALACIFAVTAQFWPQPFPDSRPLLAACCLSYFACSMALHLIVTYWEKDIILATATSTSRSLRKGMQVRTDFPRFDERYTVSVEERKPGAKPIEETWNVGNYFDYEGHFDEWGLGDAVKKLVGRLEKRVKDRKKKDKKDKKDRQVRG